MILTLNEPKKQNRMRRDNTIEPRAANSLYALLAVQGCSAELEASLGS